MKCYWLALFANIAAIICNIYATRLQNKSRKIYEELTEDLREWHNKKMAEESSKKLFTQEQVDQIVAKDKRRAKK